VTVKYDDTQLARIDATIAERVMGKEVRWEDGRPWVRSDDDGSFCESPERYSRDWASAGPVLEWLGQHCICKTVWLCYDAEEGEWWCEDGATGGGPGMPAGPLAICAYALAIVGMLSPVGKWLDIDKVAGPRGGEG
jgi:hypothetical protein